MNLTQLRAFDAVVRTGSFTAAAERLHVSQPAITAHVKALESYYGVSLLRRHGRGVQPTELGARLAAISRELFGLEESAVDLLTEHKQLRRGTLRVAADGPYVVIPLVDAFRRRFPGVKVNLWVGNTHDVQAALIEERYDVTVQADTEPDPRLYAMDLTRYRIIVFVGASHPWARAARAGISIRELHGQPMIVREPGSATRRKLEDACHAAGVEPDFAIETTSRETVKEAVAAGLGIGVISEAELRPDPRFHPLPIEDADLTYAEQVVCLDRRRDLRVVREFLYLSTTTHPDAAPR